MFISVWADAYGPTEHVSVFRDVLRVEPVQIEDKVTQTV